MQQSFYLIAQTKEKVDLGPLPGAEASPAQIETIIATVIGVAAALALLFIVIGGFRYVISRGDPQATAQAKNTILYALIGLVVSAFAFAIVRFVAGGI